MFLPAVIQPYGIDTYFPFDGAAWSLTFELIANVLYWVTFRRLHGVRLGLLIVVSAAAMIAARALPRQDGRRDAHYDFWWGVPRVALSFFIGVALRRYIYERLSFNLRDAAAPLVSCHCCWRFR